MADKLPLVINIATGQNEELQAGDVSAQADAVEIQGEPVNATPPTAGNILVFSGTEWVPGDPLVQGVYDPGTNTTTGGISSGYIKPVLIGGSDYSGTPLLHDLKIDSSGQIYLGATTNVIGKVSQDTSPWVISGAVTVSSGAITVSGTVAFSNTTIAVTNTGTFAVQATLAAETTKVIGTVNQGTNPWIISGAVTEATLDGCVSGSKLAVRASDGDVFVRSNAASTFPVTATTNADTTIAGTTAPSKGFLVLGKTADGTPAYDALPLAAGGGSVVVSGSISTTPPASVVSTLNSSTTPLGANASFVGTYESTLGYATLLITAASDEPIHSGNSFTIAWSPDAVFGDIIQYLNPLGRACMVPVLAQYFKISYQNGSTPQGTFRLQVVKTPFTVANGSIVQQGQPVTESEWVTLVGGMNATPGGDGNPDWVNTIQESNGALIRELATTIFAQGNQVYVDSSVSALTGSHFPQGRLYVTGSGGTFPVTNANLDTALSTIDTDIKSNITLHAGTNVIGKVSQDTNPWIVAGNLSEGAAMGSTNVGALVAHASATRQVHLQDKMYHLNMDLEGFLRTRTRSENMLGDVSIAPRNNQIEINFSTAFASLPITNTPTGTGTATQANGQATYSSGGTSGGRAIGVSTQTLVYRPGHALYAMFTAGFSTGGTGAGFQRIGPYGAGADGFYIGYEGSTFNFTQLKAGAATSVAKASWNGDPMDGSSSSSFTSGGSPVAIDLTKINIWRIQGSWFGAAPIRLEVLSPDSEWVICHTLRFPNTLTVPYAATTTWPITVDVQSASSTPVSIYTPCWAMGTQDQNFGITDTITDNSLAQLTRSVLVGHTTAGGGSYVNAKVNPSGALSAAVTAADGDVFVRSNAASTFPVTATLAAASVIRLQDGSGNAITSTANALDINVKGGTITGTFTPASDGATGSAVPADASFIGGSDGTNLRGITVNSTTTTSKFGLDANILSIKGTAPTTAGKLDIKIASGDVASGALASGAVASGAIASGAIAAGAIASGAAVAGSFADGASVTLGAKADAKSTATDTTAITVMQVLKQISASVQAPPSQAVTNTGTFAVQAACTGTVAFSNTTIAVTNTGTFAVQGTLAAETTKVIGTVRVLGNVGAAFDAATAATVPANAVQQGVRGATANPTAVTDGQLVAPMADKLGRQVVVLNHVRDLVTCTPTTIANTSGATEIMAAGAASTYRDIVSLIITQSSATAATATLTDGTQSFIFDLAATAGTGLSIQFPTPLKNSTTAHNWTLALSSSSITVHVTCIAVTNL